MKSSGPSARLICDEEFLLGWIPFDQTPNGGRRISIMRGQPPIVAAFCRRMNTLDAGIIVPEFAAVQCALKSLDASWSSLIQQAIDDRQIHQIASCNQLAREHSKDL